MRISLVLTIVSMLVRGAAADMIAVPPPPPSMMEAQVGGGVGVYAAALDRWLGFSIGWHRHTDDYGALFGDEFGADLDLRIGYTVFGSSLAIGVRPVARYIVPKGRVTTALGLLVPEVMWSTGDGRERAWRVEWSVPFAFKIGHHHDLIEWDIVRAGAIFAGDGAHASIGTELRFVLR